MPSQISADLDVGRRPTDNCAEICEGTVGRSLPMREKGAAASPGKLQPLPPALSCTPMHRKALQHGAEGGTGNARAVLSVRTLPLPPPLTGTAPQFSSACSSVPMGGGAEGALLCATAAGNGGRSEGVRQYGGP